MVAFGIGTEKELLLSDQPTSIRATAINVQAVLHSPRSSKALAELEESLDAEARELPQRTEHVEDEGKSY